MMNTICDSGDELRLLVLPVTVGILDLASKFRVFQHRLSFPTKFCGGAEPFFMQICKCTEAFSMHGSKSANSLLHPCLQILLVHERLHGRPFVIKSELGRSSRR